jgi:hypothetical protein
MDGSLTHDSRILNDCDNLTVEERSSGFMVADNAGFATVDIEPKRAADITANK